MQYLQGADMVSTGRVLVAVVQLCRAADRWDLLNEHVVVLARRRSQLKQAVAKMVQQCVEYVDQTPDKETMIKLIDTLRSVTEGKVRNDCLTIELEIKLFLYLDLCGGRTCKIDSSFG
jgi:hypothetical protein